MSILSTIATGVSDVLNFVKDGFCIIDTETNDVYKFDTYTDNQFDKTNQVPSQPVELNSFAVDSKIINPIRINVIAHKALSIGGLVASTGALPTFFDNTSLQNVDDFKSGLIRLANSPTIVNLIINSSYFTYSDTFNNYVLESVKWRTSAEILHLVAEMTFVEVRQSSVAFTTAQTVANPNDAPATNSGSVQTTPPKTENESSILYKILGKVA